MNKTIEYYNKHADDYYWTTVAVDMDALRKKFASYLPAEASVIDMGCGSGRDVMAFSDMGHNVLGIDASEELVKLARERLEVRVAVGDLSTFRASEPYDGIWCCAALIHLNDEEKKRFFNNLEYNLKKGGVIYISVKDGVETHEDEQGRYISNCSEAELRKYLEGAGCEILETLVTDDTLERRSFKWLNVIARKIR